jgi:UDP-N-acetylglucosamine:LPS N-acetylglucosamine transferase
MRNEELYSGLTRKRFLRIVYKTIEPYLDFSKVIAVRLIVKLYGKTKSWGEKNRVPKIFFTSQDLEWKLIRDYETNRLKKSDAFFDSIIKKLEAGGECKLVGIYPLGLSIRSLRVFIDKLISWYVLHIPFDFYWSLDVCKREKEAFRYFRDLWKGLADDEDFRKLCTSNGRNLYTHMEMELEFYFHVLFPRIVKYIEMAKQMIDKEKPDLILAVNEYGEFERALVVAGKLKGIPTLAVQHGIITPTHYGYIFSQEDKGKVLLPDTTCVYGQYHKELLTKNSIYGPEQVVVTGEPRYDVLHRVDKIYSKKEFLEKYRISPDNRILLWATQCHGLSDEENIKNLGAVFETVQNIKNATLLIKQHPGEGEECTKMIEDCLTNYKIDVVITGKSSDTYEQLFVCDLLITRSSTTAMEAVALNKPVIILNLSGEPDAVDYVEQGVALGVYKEDDLKPSIEKLLKDPSELAKNRNKYVERYLHKIDGKTTERVTQVIEKMMSTNKLYKGE